MCLRLIGSALCCCCKLGLKCLICFACSGLGVLAIVALIVYFCFFYNKSEVTTVKPSDSDSTTLGDIEKSVTSAPSLIKSYLHQLIDRY
ncbi:protein midgut expression 1 [Drosophila eugracilis]|uniref:protein midgut expression 1 n=1 Tax=Drosophila eugracilis TaxID=29029 RepID=UPI0007E742E9|nr:protein midgut expression 1 [Drosophila eugracilis]